MAIFYYRGFDDEMRAVVARNLEGRGIDLHPRSTLTEVIQIIGIQFLQFFFILLHASMITFGLLFVLALKILLLIQLIKTDDGIKVITDHGEELIADVVLFATGNY